MTIKPIAAAIAAAALLAAANSQAAITAYTSQSAFLAAVGTRGVDTFDNLGPGSFATTYSRSAGAFGYVANVVDDKNQVDSFFNAGSAADTWLSTNTGVDRIVFTGFAANVKGIGANFFGTNVDGGLFANQPLSITLTDAAGSDTETLFNTTSTSFLGFVTSTSLVSMTVQLAPGASASAWPAVNNLTLAAAVPEPSTYALMAAGLFVVSAWARRRMR